MLSKNSTISYRGEPINPDVWPEQLQCPKTRNSSVESRISFITSKTSEAELYWIAILYITDVTVRIYR